jgi:hypothetical protein
MEQQLRKNKEYNLQVQEYYRQREEQRDTTFSQQCVTLQVSMIVNNVFWKIEHLICITNKLRLQAYFEHQCIPFLQVQLPPLAPPPPPQSWIHHTRHASAEVYQT